MDLLKDARKEGITTGDLKAFTLDVSSLESVRSFAEQIKQNYSKINILLNNGNTFQKYVKYKRYRVN